MINLFLRDLNAEMVAAWEGEFQGLAQVDISCGNILDLKASAIVSPANSFGHMDGGIDLAYSRFFGWELEGQLRDLLKAEHFGELPVGQAVLVPTSHHSIPFLVSAPTMRVPSVIARTVNVYLAFRAALIAVIRHNAKSKAKIESLLVPGLGTGVGEMPFARAARQMRVAYDAIVLEGAAKDRNVGRIWGEHHDLLS
jgi:O-acetyl-ADP-ribose deacetylase (regulator of RNase III)